MLSLGFFGSRVRIQLVDEFFVFLFKLLHALDNFKKFCIRLLHDRPEEGAKYFRSLCDRLMKIG